VRRERVPSVLALPFAPSYGHPDGLMGKSILGLRKALQRWLGSSGGEGDSAGPGAGAGDEVTRAASLDPEVRQSPAVVALFLRTAPAQAAEMRAALAAGKVSDLRALAHKLRGSCLVMGATVLATNAKALEELAAIDGASEGLRELERELARVEELLKGRG